MENEKVVVNGGPESSLSWCLSQLLKAETSVKGGSRGGGEDTKESTRKAQSALWRALVAIRTQHTKGGSAGIKRFRARGGLRPLLKLLQWPACDRKTLDLALSILANCCTESGTRVEVRKLEGISIVVEILKNVTVETVQNRAARALGNLAIDSDNSALIHAAGGVPLLLQCLSTPGLSQGASTLSSTPSSVAQLECTQSAARALLYLSDTPINRLTLLSQGAFPALAQLLSSKYPHGLRRASLRALHELTKGCGVECAREVVRTGALTQLGDLALGGTKEPLAELALKILANLCAHGSLRPLVGSVGVIPKFVEEVKNEPARSGLFFRALCLCCKEAVNRVKVKESGGLEVLIGSLASCQSHPFARLALLAFVDFVYDEAALEQLQGLGLVSLLVARLVSLAKEECPMTGAMDAPGASSSCDPMSNSCLDSFDFPPLGTSRKDGEMGKEQGQESSSFLSLRSWLLSEGLISCEGELQAPSGSGEGEADSTAATPLSDRLSPLAGLSTSSTPGPKSPSASPGKPPPASTSTPKTSLNSASVFQSTPSSQKATPSSPSKPSSPKKKPRHLLVSPAETPPALKAPAYQHPYHPEPWTAESPILLLLSRFSQSVDPSSALINSGTISGLLYYLTHHKDPSSRCFRVLCRLSCNPNCLEGLVRTGSVALIWYCLCLREGEEEESEGQADRVKAKVRQLGKAVLNNLRVQSESSFGSGVLTHIMLSGSDTDRLYCTLALPLINSNKALLRKLLMDHGGLQLALEALGSLGEDDDPTVGRWGVLSSWLHTPEPASSSHLCSLYFSLLTECLLNLLGCPMLGLNMDTELRSGKGAELNHHGVSDAITCEPPPVKKQCPAPSCPYLDSDFDLVFLLDDSTQVPANTEAVVGGGERDSGSEYFRALLRGGFWEARRSSDQKIPIKDVTSHMLLPVVHYLHGCSVSNAIRGEYWRSGAHGRPGAGHCPVLGSLTSGVLEEWKQRIERESLSYEEGLFPLAQAMKGANMFLVPGLQRELEDFVVSLLLTLAGSQPEFPFSETPHFLSGSCEQSPDEKQALQPSTAVRMSSDGEACCETDDRSQLEMALGPWLSSQLTFESGGSFGDVVGSAVDGRASDNSELQCTSLWALSPGVGTKSDCSLGTLLSLRSGSKLLCKREQRKNGQLCHASDCSFGSDLNDVYSEETRSVARSCSCAHAAPGAKLHRRWIQTCGQDCGTHSLSSVEAARRPEAKSDKEARRASEGESEPAECNAGERSWRLGMCLPPLYHFAQLHGYSRLARTCLSVLLQPQQRTPRPSASATAACLRQLAQEVACVEGLRRDLLALAGQVLN